MGKTLDEIWFSEFNSMMSQRRQSAPRVELEDIAVPPEIENFSPSPYKACVIGEIDDKYYGALSDKHCRLWTPNRELSDGGLKRRDLDAYGNFMSDKEGNFKVHDVKIPSDCVCIMTDVKVGAPLAHKVKDGEHFEAVDYVEDKETGDITYLYIVPAKYVYRESETALLLTYNKRSSSAHNRHYGGWRIALVTGHYLYAYIISHEGKHIGQGRVIWTKLGTIDYDEELHYLYEYWLNNGFLFMAEMCETTADRGYPNAGFMAQEATEGVFVACDKTRSLADEKAKTTVISEEDWDDSI